MNARAISGQRRIEAQLSGNVFYLPATKCPKGHQLKYSATGTCVECEAARKEMAATTPHRLGKEALEVLARVHFGLSLVHIAREMIDSLKRRGCLTNTLQLTEQGTKALENARRRFRKSRRHSISV